MCLYCIRSPGSFWSIHWMHFALFVFRDNQLSAAFMRPSTWATHCTPVGHRKYMIRHNSLMRYSALWSAFLRVPRCFSLQSWSQRRLAGGHDRCRQREALVRVRAGWMHVPAKPSRLAQRRCLDISLLSSICQRVRSTEITEHRRVVVTRTWDLCQALPK